jgi:thymidine phosphorylase
LKAAHRQAEDCLDSGKPRQKWNEMLAAQGADLDAFASKLRLERTAPVALELRARKGGYVSRCDARIIGEVVRDLGGGRVTKDSVINYDVGVDRLAKPGERMSAGSVLARIHAVDKKQGETARARLESAFFLRSGRPRLRPLIFSS